MNASPSSVKTRKLALLLFLLVAAGAALTLPGTIGSQTARAAADQKTTTTDNSGVTYDITTLAGKVVFWSAAARAVCDPMVPGSVNAAPAATSKKRRSASLRVFTLLGEAFI